MKAVIIEDEEFAAKRLGQMVNELAPEIEILASLNSVESGSNWFANNKSPDLVFLDIQLNDGYGFDILDDLEEHPPVIFTTAYNEFAIRGFKYNGLDYLLKPIVKDDLKKALEKFKKKHYTKWQCFLRKSGTFKTVVPQRVQAPIYGQSGQYVQIL